MWDQGKGKLGETGVQETEYKIHRRLKQLKFFMSDGARIEGYAHIPLEMRESDYFESTHRGVIALTDATIFRNGNEINVPTVVINKDHAVYFEVL